MGWKVRGSIPDSAKRFFSSEEVQNGCGLEKGSVLCYLEQSRCLEFCYHNVILQQSVFYCIEFVNAIFCVCGLRPLGQQLLEICRTGDALVSP